MGIVSFRVRLNIVTHNLSFEIIKVLLSNVINYVIVYVIVGDWW